MDKRSKIALYFIGAVILLMMIAEVTKPKALNWRDSYSAADKIPLGCFVLYNELQTFTNEQILESNVSVYEYLKRLDTLTPKTLVLINDYISFDNEESDALLNFVENGNSVFISSTYFYGNAIDTLNVSLQRLYSNIYKKISHQKFTSPSLEKNNTVFDEVIENSFFESIDTLKTTVLGTMTFKDENDKENTNINFIKVPFGNKNGYFYLHTNPFAFSNYHLLNGNENYAATVLSFLPEQQLIWDNYYKSGRKVIRSPLRYILTNNALKWAFYVALFSLFLFILFKGKRTQRIIPVIEPLKNSTVEFTQTIGDLYYQHKDYSNIIAKKNQYFFEFVRTSYYLNTNELNPQFINKLAIKSSNTKEETKALIDYIVYLKSKSLHSEKELIQLNKLIEQFTKNNI
jgi:hypothetical protein